MAKITVVAKCNIYPDNCCTDPILAGEEFTIDSSMYCYYVQMEWICVDDDETQLIDNETLFFCDPCAASEAQTAALTDILNQILTAVETPNGIEVDATDVGCVMEDGVIVGKVVACKKVDELTQEVSFEYFLIKPGEAAVAYTGDWEFCEPECIPSGMQVIEGPLCGQAVFICGGICKTFNSETKQFEILDTVSNKIGVNAQTVKTESRPFTCEFPADGADVSLSSADIIASLAGATFSPSGLPADDAATVYLNSFEATLTHIGDEAEGGFVASNCQAVFADAQTGKTKDLEPGGNYELSVDKGVDIPDFKATVEAGSNLVVCGEVTIVLDKAGTAAVAK